MFNTAEYNLKTIVVGCALACLARAKDTTATYYTMLNLTCRGPKPEASIMELKVLSSGEELTVYSMENVQGGNRSIQWECI